MLILSKSEELAGGRLAPLAIWLSVSFDRTLLFNSSEFKTLIDDFQYKSQGVNDSWLLLMIFVKCHKILFQLFVLTVAQFKYIAFILLSIGCETNRHWIICIVRRFKTTISPNVNVFR